jgi:hypothetical protein
MDTIEVTEQRKRLVEDRQRQRRRLTAAPNDFFEGVKWDAPPPAVLPSTDAEAVEVYVRQWADEVLTPEAAAHLDQRITANLDRHARKLLDILSLDAPTWSGVEVAVV